MTEKREAFMTPSEVADLLKVSIYTVRRWINQRTIPAYKVGRGWRIETSEFKDWLKEQRGGQNNGDSATGDEE